MRRRWRSSRALPGSTRGWATIAGGLVAEAAARGYPVVRHPFLHFPEDPDTRALRYQFLLGPNLMVAPVLDPGVATVQVYFPAGSAWTDLWSGEDAGVPGEWVAMPAPLGRPAVFLRRGAAAGEAILRGLREAGVSAGGQDG